MIFRTRKVVKPGDLNALNTLFGGRLLEWVDEECAIYCGCQLGTNDLATKLMSEINFRRTAAQRDVIEIGVETVAIGRTSITVRCEVRDKDSGELILEIARVVFVALDRKGRPVPHRLSGEQKPALPPVAERAAAVP